MKARIKSKCMLLALPVALLAILAGVGVMAASDTDDVITYRGRSLRIDAVTEENQTAAQKTSLRFGYKIQLPEGASLSEDGVSWEYTVDGKNPEESQTSIKTLKATDIAENTDGSKTANVVIKGVPSSYYRRTFYVRMTVKYTLDGEEYTLTEGDWHSTTIKDVTDAIIAAETDGVYDSKYKQDKEYAQTLQTEIETYAALAGDRMYTTTAAAISKVANGGTVTILKINGVTEAITIDKAVTLENQYGTSVTLKDTRDSQEDSMLKVASSGELTIAGGGLTIIGDIYAEGKITLEKGTVKGQVILSDKDGGVSLIAGASGKITDGGLTGAHEDGTTRTNPLLILQDESSVPAIYVSETTADTLVLEIPDALTVSSSIQSASKNKLTCTADAQLMWGPYGGDGKTVTVQSAAKHIHCSCGGNVSAIAQCGTGHWDIEYTELESTTKAHLGGNYYLAEDITISDTLKTGTGSYSMNYGKGDLNLCLNGYVLTSNGNQRILYNYKTSSGTTYSVSITGICSATKSDTAKIVEASDGNDGKVSIQYGTLKKVGTGSVQGGCIYNAGGCTTKLYNVYLDGSEYQYTGTALGATMYNGSSIAIFNCLISKHSDNTNGAYNGHSGTLPYVDATKNAYLYEFPAQ